MDRVVSRHFSFDLRAEVIMENLYARPSITLKDHVIKHLALFLRTRLSSLLFRTLFQKPTFVITTNPGAFLGNQLTIFAHLIAYAMENGREIWGTSFFLYAKHFESTSRDLFSRYPKRRSLLPRSQSLRVFLYYYGFARLVRVVLLHPEPPVKDVAVITDYDGKRPLESLEFRGESAGKRVVVIEGYFFRTSGAMLERHSVAVKEYFRPLKDHEARASAVVRKARVGAQVLVGVHLRQFDAIIDHSPPPMYRYEHAEQMSQVLHRTVGLFSGKEVKFLLFSNGRIKRSLFSGLPTMEGTGHIAEDLHALSLCDYILASTYSSYSRWASFYGNVPLYQVDDPGAEFSVEDFMVRVPGLSDPTSEVVTSEVIL
jgi:hypothetical protein